MNLNYVIGFALAASIPAFFGNQAQGAQAGSAILPADVPWKASSIPGVQTAVIVGDPAQPGLYVVRAKLGPGAKVMPHTHPDARYDTVLSGEIYFGFGGAFDPANAKLYPAGAQIMVPANTPHFAWVKNGQAILQEVGVGPSAHLAYKQ